MTAATEAEPTKDTGHLRKEIRIEKHPDGYLFSYWDGSSERWRWDTKGSVEEIVQHLRAYLEV